MKDILQAVGKQLLPIFLSAIAAAAIAFAQSLGAHAGYCPAPVASPQEVGLLGGILKAVHSIARVTIFGHSA